MDKARNYRQKAVIARRLGSEYLIGEITGVMERLACAYDDLALKLDGQTLEVGHLLRPVAGPVL